MNIQKIKGFIIGVIAICSLHACVDVDKTLGLDYVPDDQWIQVDFHEFTIPVYTAAVDSICTSNSSVGSIGYMVNDPFGLFYTGAVFRFVPISVYYSGSSYTYPEGAILDSVILHIPVSHKMVTNNESKMAQTLYLHQLTRDLQSNTDTYYYNNSLKETDYDPVAVAGPYEYKGEDTIKIHLSTAFAHALMSATEAEMGNDTAFHQRFKGLYLTVDTTSAVALGRQGGRVVYFSHANASITSYYHNSVEDDTTRYCLYYLNTDYANFNVLKHNSAHLVSNLPSSQIYIEGLAGVKPYINFNLIKEEITYLLDSLNNDPSKLLINRLEIKLDVDYPTYTMDTYPILTTLAYKVDTSAYRFEFLTDTYLSSFGGTLNRSLQQYSYNPTYFAQGLFTPHLYDTSDETRRLYIYPYYTYYDSYYGMSYHGLERTEYSFGVLKGPLRVKLSYTLLK